MLTDKAIQALKPSKRPKKVSDGYSHLMLTVYPTGRKTFSARLNDRGKEIVRKLGDYPVLTLAEARRQAEQMRDNVAINGLDETFYNTTVGDLISLYRKKKMQEVRTATLKIVDLALASLEPLSDTAISKVTYKQIAGCLIPIIDRGAVSVAHNTRLYLIEFLRFCKGQGHRINFAIGDAAEDLLELIPRKPATEHRRAITTEEELRLFCQNINAIGNPGRFMVIMQLLTLTRPNEVLRAKWSEIDLVSAVWTIPPEKMKSGKEHKIHLAPELVAILRKWQGVVESKDYVFPGMWGGSDHACINSQRNYIRRIAALAGLPESLTAHGLRATASTILNAKGFAPDVIEAALAHTPRNVVRAAYNRHDYWQERVKMLDFWAKYIEELSK